ncbi:MAG: Rieske (2Fe-2S) protein [Saprospiraceae bacterium]|jgi:Rieske Fe-S protein|nr:Rieske (2Fe-2S) protein [Lewinellaceae bacterium]
MQRRQFLKTTCFGAACCFAGGSLLLNACGTAVYYAEHQVAGKRLVLKKSAFRYTTKKGELRERNFVLVRPAGLGFPISVFRGPSGYSACLLRCTHQACEVEVQGSRYACPCHGSEFDVQGAVLQGPAEQALLTYKIEEDAQHIYILLA